MRRQLALVVTAALALAGCGAASSSPSPSSARATELSYFPAGSPFVMSILTDPNASAIKQAQALAGRFPIATLGRAALISKLQQQGLDYQNDIRPLFGNPVTLGAAGGTPSRSGFLLVWVTRDASKLGTLVKKLGLHSAGSHDRATLYQSSAATTLALDGATAVFGASPAAVSAALDRHAHGGGIGSVDFARALSGLPQDALVQTYGSLGGLLSTPRTAKARNVPWVAALRGYGASISATSSGLTFQYRLDTTGGTLSSSQLPIAGGSAGPSLAGVSPITVALNDPAQVVSFAQAAEQATNPPRYGAFLKRQAASRARTGVDLQSLFKLLNGQAILANDTHITIARATVRDPAAAARTLSKLVRYPRSISPKATGVSKIGGGFFALKGLRRSITIGVIGDQLVAGNAPVSRLRAFAAAPTVPAAGAHGSVAFRVALVELLHLALRQAPPKIAQTILASLGDLTGWLAASPSGLTGSATLALK